MLQAENSIILHFYRVMKQWATHNNRMVLTIFIAWVDVQVTHFIQQFQRQRLSMKSLRKSPAPYAFDQAAKTRTYRLFRILHPVPLPPYDVCPERSSFRR